MIEIKSCVGCGLERVADKTLEVTDPFRVSAARFQMQRCVSCGTWMLNPRPAPDEMLQFYNTDFLYAPSAKKSFVAKLATQVQSFNLSSETNWIRQYLPTGGRWLDFAAGNGQILEAVARERSDARLTAIEYSKAFHPAIAANAPNAAIYSDISQLKDDAQFELITAFGAFEHVEDPAEMLRSLRSVLSESGVILLSIPNPESFQAHLFGQRWYSWIAPRHFQMMPRRTFATFAKRTRLAVVGEKHFFLRTAPASFVVSAFPGLDPLIEPSPLKLVAYGALFAALLPVELGLSAFRSSGFMGFEMKNVSE